MREATDAELVHAAQAGDKGAFARLLQRHRSWVLVLCLRVLHDRGAAEDATQEAALQAMLSLNALRRPERFGAWLAGIALNMCRRLLGAEDMRTVSWDALQGGRAGPKPMDFGPSPEEMTEAAELSGRVRNAVATLPSGQRAAVLLVYLAGLSQSEAAAALGIEISAVKSRLHKARLSLRRRLLATWREHTMADQGEDLFIDVEVVDVRRRPIQAGSETSLHAVVLQEIGADRRLAIFVGAFEAWSIAMRLQKIDVARPLTYAFLANVLQAAGGRLAEVQISKLVQDTYYATAVVEGPSGTRAVDARPSDALALALECGTRIRVAARVFDALAAATRDLQPPRPDPVEGLWAENTQGAQEIMAESTRALGYHSLHADRSAPEEP